MQVRVRVRRDLRQVGHAQHLVMARQAPQAAADRIGGPAADARVHLVEHERGVRRRAQHVLDGASATRDSSPPDAMRASGRAGSPGLGASRKRDRVGAGRVEGRGVDVDAERGDREAQLDAGAR